jgi:hypothetical protein
MIKTIVGRKSSCKGVREVLGDHVAVSEVVIKYFTHAKNGRLGGRQEGQVAG